MPKPRKYWIVKHGLDSLQALPRYIWRTGEKKEPRSFRSVRLGDRWIGFAYTSSDSRERPLSHVTGFYECIRKSVYRPIPAKGRELEGSGTHAWMIEGSSIDKKFDHPVGVPPLEKLLDRKYYRQSSLIPISAEKFARIKKYARDHRLNPAKIPALGREPRYEQEMLAIIGQAYASLGIERILRVQTVFPDMLVKLKGRQEPVHLELEVYSKSYLNHGHSAHVDRKGRFKAVIDGVEQNYAVGVLCWIDDAGEKKLKAEGRVQCVIALKDLLLSGRPITWRK